MTDRDRLKAVFKKIKYKPFQTSSECDFATQFTDYALDCIVDGCLANGVIVPPCKVGGKAWFIVELDDKSIISEETVVDFSTKGFYYSEFLNGTGAQILVPYEEIGENVFFGKEKAEAKLKELKDNA